MTVKQKQHLLGFLGYYVCNVDGEWGQISKTATKSFQQDHGLTPDGVFGDATAKAARAAVASGETKKPETPAADDWDDIEFFSNRCGRCQGRNQECIADRI